METSMDHSKGELCFPSFSRRAFLALALGSTVLGGAENLLSASSRRKKVMTVLGEIPAGKMGLTLSHEHVLCDFIGAEKVSRDRYNAEEAFQVMLPLLQEAKQRGVQSFVDCTPMFIGRDPLLLKRLSQATGLHLLTTTGLYKEPFLPTYAFKETAEQLAQRWINEFKYGIEGTGIKPGFIKIAVNPGQLLEVQKKILQAAALTSRKTGLTVGCHTGHGEAAMESLELLQAWKFPLRKYIVIHADSIPEPAFHTRIAEAGAWVSFDGVGGRPVEQHVEMITRMIKAGHIGRLLLSHDAGWYNVGDPKGGKPRPFTSLTDELVPALKRSGITGSQIQQLLVKNPATTFSLG